MATEGSGSFIFKEIFMNYGKSWSSSLLRPSPLIIAQGKKRGPKENADTHRTTSDLFIGSECVSLHKLI